MAIPWTTAAQNHLLTETLLQQWRRLSTVDQKRPAATYTISWSAALALIYVWGYQTMFVSIVFKI